MNNRDDFDALHKSLVEGAMQHPDYAKNKVSAIHGYSEGVEHALDTVRTKGYSKPRTIETVEELLSLHMVVVRTNAGSIVNIVNERAYAFGYEYSDPAETLALPATVLYEPGAGQ